MKLFQNESLGQIYIEVIESLESFNVENATGFESEDEKNNDDSADQSLQKPDEKEGHKGSENLEKQPDLEDKGNNQLLN